jgi:DNA-binding NarL/FixJ family response regulator
MPSASGDRNLPSAASGYQLRRTHAGSEGAPVKEVWNLSTGSSTEADVIERLIILATSIAVDSHQQSILHGFVALLRSVICAIEADELISFGPMSRPPISIAGMKKTGRTTTALTTRQQEVLQLRSMGFGVDAIAEHLNLTPRTVRTHIRDAVERLGVTGGAMAAVAEARSLGLI